MYTSASGGDTSHINLPAKTMGLRGLFHLWWTYRTTCLYWNKIFFYMHVPLRNFLLFAFALVVLRGGESRIPRLYEYHSGLSQSNDASETDVIVLENFLVLGVRYRLPPIIEKGLERALKNTSFPSRIRRFEIIPDDSEDVPSLLTDANVIPMIGTSDRFDLRVQDVFLIDLPGGGVLKARFRSGVSVRVNNHTQIILRPSRKRLVSIRWDW